MSMQQAEQIAQMSPSQMGKILGLPASQAAKILSGGVDFYAITPKAGVTPTIFTSKVAGVTQGEISMPGGGVQVIVPNRNLWQRPQKINPPTNH
jgi:filamentous hemagglutinin